MAETSFVGEKFHPENIDDLMNNKGVLVNVLFPVWSGIGHLENRVYTGFVDGKMEFIGPESLKLYSSLVIYAERVFAEDVELDENKNVLYSAIERGVYTSTMNEIKGKFGQRPDDEFVDRWNMLKRVGWI